MYLNDALRAHIGAYETIDGVAEDNQIHLAIFIMLSITILNSIFDT